MPSKSAILKYWQDADHDLDDGQFVPGQCFACGARAMLERAHIRPACRGGSNTPRNLHLLCRRCHIESEAHEAANYWKWYEFKLCHGFDFGLKTLAQGIASGAYVPTPEDVARATDGRVLATQEQIAQEIESIKKWQCAPSAPSIKPADL
jgi:hypothetical protein